MKKCTYCGTDNESAATHCRSCGTELPVTSPPPPIPAASTLPPGGPGSPEVASGMSKWAILSFVMGLLGLCGIPAVIGIIAGIVALVQMGKNKRLRGQGLAIAGLVLSGIFLLSTPALMLPALARAKARAQRIACVNNLKQVALGIRVYASENGGRLPAADRWNDSILPNVESPKVFHCPASRTEARCTYALNSNLSGRAVTEIDPQTVLLFEIAEGWNVSGGKEEMLAHDPHRKAFNVAFADGSVRQMSRAQAEELRWHP